jgi:hypothetical protein
MSTGSNFFFETRMWVLDERFFEVDEKRGAEL